MSVTSKRDDGHHDSLGSDGFEVRLGEETYAHGVSGLGKNNGIFAKAHGTWFEPIAVDADWNVTPNCSLLTESKAWKY